MGLEKIFSASEKEEILHWAKWAARRGKYYEAGKMIAMVKGWHNAENIALIVGDKEKALECARRLVDNEKYDLVSDIIEKIVDFYYFKKFYPEFKKKEEKKKEERLRLKDFYKALEKERLKVIRARYGRI